MLFLFNSFLLGNLFMGSETKKINQKLCKKPVPKTVKTAAKKYFSVLFIF